MSRRKQARCTDGGQEREAKSLLVGGQERLPGRADIRVETWRSQAVEDMGKNVPGGGAARQRPKCGPGLEHEAPTKGW